MSDKFSSLKRKELVPPSDKQVKLSSTDIFEKKKKDMLVEVQNLILIHGEAHTAVAGKYHEIGELLQRHGKFEEARSYLEKALEVREKMYGELNEQTIDTLYIIGQNMGSSNMDPQKTRDHLIRTLALREKLDAANSAAVQLDGRTGGVSLMGLLESSSIEALMHISNNDILDSTLLYSDLAEDSRVKGNISIAEPLYKRSLELRRARYGDRSAPVIQSLITYAQFQRDAGDTLGAKASIEEALGTSVSLYGHEHATVADCTNSLGQILRYLGNAVEAESLYLEALSLRRKLLGDYHVQVAGTLNNLAELYSESGDYLLAIQYHKAAIDIFEKTAGPTHPGTVNAKGNLGITYRRQSKECMELSGSLVRDAVQYLHVHKYESSHPWLIKFQSEFFIQQAQILSENGKFSESLEILDSVRQSKDSQALKSIADMVILEKGVLAGTLGKVNSLIANALYNEAYLVLDHYYNEYAAGAMTALGEFSLNMIEIDIIYGEILMHLLKFEDAKNVFVTCLQKCNSVTEEFKVAGVNDSAEGFDLMRLRATINLADWHRHKAFYANAVEYYNQAAVFVTKVLEKQPLTIASSADKNGWYYAKVFIGCAELHRSLGNINLALDFLEKAKKVCHYCLDKDHLLRAECMICEANILRYTSQFKEARKLINDVSVLRLKHINSPWIPQLITPNVHLAIILWYECDFEHAEALLLKALTDRKSCYLEKNGLENHPSIGNCLFWLGKVALSLGKLDAAENYFTSASSCFEHTVKSDHPSVARCLVGLAEILLAKGSVLSAQKMLMDAIQIQRAHFCVSVDTTHFIIAESLLVLGKCDLYCGKSSFAIKNITEALDIYHKVFGSGNSFGKLDCKITLAECHVQHYAVDKAKEVLFETVSGLTLVLFEYNHFSKAQLQRCLLLAQFFCTLGRLNTQWGLYKNGKMLFSRSMGIYHRVLGPHHAEVVRVLLFAADNLRIPGYYLSAVETLLDAIRILTDYCQYIKKDHVTYLLAMRLQALLGMYAQDFEGSLTLLEENFVKYITVNENLIPVAYVDSTKRFPPCSSNYYLSLVYLDIAECLVNLNRLDESLYLIGLCTDMRKDNFGVNGLPVAECFYLKALVLLHWKGEANQALHALTDFAVPLYDAFFRGGKHPFLINLKGNVGLCKNLIKPGSSQGVIDDSAKFFDEYSQFPFASDHPWVVALGGYVDANSALRSSDNIKETCLETWAKPRFDGDLEYGEPIQLNNSSEPQDKGAMITDIWHEVWFHQEEDVKMAQAKQEMKEKLERERVEALKEEARLAEEARVLSENAEKRRLQEEKEKQEELIKAMEDKQKAQKEMIESKAKAVKSAADSKMKKAEEARIKAAEREKEAQKALENSEAVEENSELNLQNGESDASAPVGASVDKGSVLTVQVIDPGLSPEELLRIRALEAANYLLNRGIELHSVGEYKSAVPLLVEALFSREKYLEEGDSAISEVLLKIADNYHVMRDYEEADKYYQKCQNCVVAKNSYVSRECADVLLKIVFNYQAIGKVIAAGDKLLEVLYIRTNTVGEDDASMGIALYHQALNFIQLGRYMEAKSSAERAHSVLHRLYGNRNIDVVRCVFVKARALTYLGKYSEAKPIYEQCIAFQRSLLPGDDVELGRSAIEVGKLLLYIGTFEECRKFFAQANYIFSNGYRSDPDHSDRLEIRFWLAQLEYSLGHISRALKEHHQILVSRLKYLKPDHFLIGDSYFAIADIYHYNLGLYDVAKVLYDKAYEIRKVSLGYVENSPEITPKIGDCFHAFGEYFKNMGNFESAKTLFEKAIDIYNNALSKDHPSFLLTSTALAGALVNMKKFDEATAIYRRVLRAQQKHLGREHPDCAVTLNGFSNLYRIQGQFPDASAANIESISIRRHCFGETHWSVQESLNNKVVIALDALNSTLLKKQADQEASHVSLSDVEGAFQRDESGVPIFDKSAFNSLKGNMQTCIYSIVKGNKGIPFDLFKIVNNELSINMVASFPKLDAGLYSPDDNEIDFNGFDLVDPNNSEYAAVFKFPMMVNCKGNLGIIMKSEADELERFISQLNSIDRKLIRNQINMIKDSKKKEEKKASDEEEFVFNSKDEDVEFEGYEYIAAAIDWLNYWKISTSHPWYVKFNAYYISKEKPVSDVDIATRLIEKGKSKFYLGLFVEAERLYEEAYGILNECLDPTVISSSPELATLLYHYAENSRIVGKYKQAHKFYTESFLAFRKSEGEYSGGCIDCLTGLGQLYLIQGLYDDARSYLERAHNLAVNYGQGKLVKVNSIFAETLRCLGKYADANKMLNSAKELMEKFPIDEAYELHLHFGKLFLELNKFEVAKIEFSTAFDLAVKKLPADHPELSRVIHCQAEHAYITGNFEEAKKLCMAAVKMKCKALGKIHFSVAKDKEEIGVTLEPESSFLYQPLEICSGMDAVAEFCNPDGEGEPVGEIEKSGTEKSLEETISAVIDDCKAAGSYTFMGFPVNRHLLIAESVYLLAFISLTYGEYNEARKFFRNCLFMQFEISGKASVFVADGLYGIGLTDKYLGEYKSAHMKLSGAAALRSQLLTLSHPSVAHAQCEFSMVEALIGSYSDSLRHLNQVLKSYSVCYKGNIVDKDILHYKVCNCLAGIAKVQKLSGELSKSKETYERCYALSKKCIGEGHLKTAVICMGLGETYYSLGDMEMANGLVEQGLSVISLILNSEHDLYADGLFLTALIARERGKFTEVKKMLEHCVAIRKQKLGKSHIETCVALFYVGCNLNDTAKYDAAKIVFEKNLRVFKSMFPNENNAVCADVYFELGENAKYSGEYQKSLTYHEKALAIRNSCLGGNHFDVASSVCQIAAVKMTIYTHFSDYIRDLDDAIAILRLSVGQAHRKIATAMYWLGYAHFLKGSLQDCKYWLTRSESMLRKLFGSENPGLAEATHLNGILLKKLGSIDQACTLFDRCVSMKRDMYGPHHPSTADSLYQLGECLSAAGRYSLATTNLTDAFGIRRNIFGKVNPKHPAIAENLFGLAECLRLRGKYTVIKPGKPGFLLSKEAIGVLAPGMGSTTDSLFTDNSSVRSNGLSQESMNFEGSKVLPSLHELNTMVEMADLVTPDKEVVSVEDIVAALPSYKSALSYRKLFLEPNHPLILDCQFGIAETLRSMGRYKDCLKIYEEVYLQRRKILGDDHIDTVISMLGLGELLRTLSIVYPEKPAMMLVNGKKVLQQSEMTAKFYRDESVIKSNHATLKEQFDSIGYENNFKNNTLPRIGSPTLPSARHTSRLPTSPERNSRTCSRSIVKENMKQGGYMGYSFPESKQIAHKEPTGAARPTKVLLRDALWLFEAGIETLKKLCGEAANVHPLTASLLFGKSELLKCRREKEKAKLALADALAIRRAALKPDHPEVADALHVMGEDYRLNHMYSKALPLYEKALELRRIAFSTGQGNAKHSSIAESLNSIGLLYYEQGNYSEAEVLLREALAMRETIFDTSSLPLHPAIAQSLNNLAAVLHSQGHLLEAECAYRNALVIKIDAFGPAHPDTAIAMNNLGLILKDIGGFSEARELFEDALRIQRQHFVVNHPDIAATLNNFGSLLMAMHSYDQARESFRQSLAMKEDILGIEHPSSANTLNNLASLAFIIKDFEEAKDLYERCLTVRKKIYGDNHIFVAETLNNIGLILFTQKEYGDALKLFEEALRIKVEAYEWSTSAERRAMLLSDGAVAYNDKRFNISIAYSLHNIAMLHHESGNLERAKVYYEKAIKLREEYLGKDHPDTVAAQQNHGVLIQGMKENEDERAQVLSEDPRIFESFSVGSIRSLGQEKDIVF